MVLNQLFDSDAHCPCSALKAMLPLERGGGVMVVGADVLVHLHGKSVTHLHGQSACAFQQAAPLHTAHLNTNAHSIVKRMTTKKRSCSKASTSAATNMRTLMMAWRM